MTKLEYDERISAIEVEAYRKKKDLNRECAISNNKVSVGDVVEDHVGKVKVDKIKIGHPSGWGLPVCVYEGWILTKSGDVTKLKEKRRSVWQSNLKP